MGVLRNRLTGGGVFGKACRGILSVFLLVPVLAALFGYMPAEGAQKVVTVATWSNVRYEQIRDAVVPYINKKHPDIKVEAQIFPNYWNKLYVMAASKEAPDIFEASGGYLFDFVLADTVVNLDPYIKRDLRMEDYFGPPWLEFRYPYRTGSHYAVPSNWVVSILAYNKDMFDLGGLDYPDESWDWETLLRAAQKLTKDTSGDGRIDQWGFLSSSGVDFGYTFFDPLLRSFGGIVLNETRTESKMNSPEGRKALQFVVDMIHAYRVAPAIGTAAFERKGAAMTITGSWNATYVYRNITGFDWDIAMLPKGPKGRVVYGGSNCWAVMRRPGQDMEAVWTVLKELLSEKAQSEIQGTWVPVNRAAALSERWLERHLPPAHKIAIIKSAPYMRDADWSPGWSQWQAARAKEIDMALRGQRSVEASLAAADAAVNLVLKTYKGNIR